MVVGLGVIVSPETDVDLNRDTGPVKIRGQAEPDTAIPLVLPNLRRPHRRGIKGKAVILFNGM